MSPRETRFAREAVLDPRLTRNDFRVLALIGSHTGRDGWSRRSHATMGAELGLDRRSVIRCVHRLVRFGWLEIERVQLAAGGNASNRYRVVIPAAQAELELAVAARGDGDTAVTMDGDSAVTRDGDSGSHYPGDSQSHHIERSFSNEEPPSLRSGGGSRDKRDDDDDRRHAVRSSSRRKAIPGQRELLPPADAARLGVRSPRSAPSRITPGWRPSDVGTAYAIRSGLSPPAVDIEAERFRDHWLRKPGRSGWSQDWSAAWRTWVRKAAERRQSEEDGHGKRGAGGSEAERVAAAFRDLAGGARGKPRGPG